MSKDTPEVGDVWLFDNTKWSIIEKIGYSAYGITGLENKFPKIEGVSDILLIEQGTYLGKSKAKITDLFEVQDDKD